MASKIIATEGACSDAWLFPFFLLYDCLPKVSLTDRLTSVDDPSVILLSEDGLPHWVFYSAVDSYVQSLGKPELLDLVARNDAMDVDTDDIRPNKKAVVYGEVHLNILRGTLLKSTIE